MTNLELDKYKIICITGKIASGKNYFTTKLEKEGWLSIDADLVAHQAIKECKKEILTFFMPIAKEKNINIVLENGEINRRALGSILFSNKILLKKQEEILYPYITKYIEDFIIQNENKKIIINATNLYKIPALMNKCEIIIYIKTSYLNRIKRIKTRDNLPFNQIIKRIKSQKNLLTEYKKTGIPIKVLKN